MTCMCYQRGTSSMPTWIRTELSGALLPHTEPWDTVTRNHVNLFAPVALDGVHCLPLFRGIRPVSANLKGERKDFFLEWKRQRLIGALTCRLYVGGDLLTPFLIGNVLRKEQRPRCRAKSVKGVTQPIPTTVVA